MATKKPRKPHGGLAVRRSKPGAGLGLFTEEAIKKGDFVIEYFGTLITNEEADTLGTKYIFEVDDHVSIDGSQRSNLARYINHSCRPNCEAEADEDDKRIFIYAKRGIKPGEELTYDYGDEYFQEFIKPIGCKCEKCTA